MNFFTQHMDNLIDNNFDQKGIFNSLFLLLSEIFTIKLKETILKVNSLTEEF